MSPRAISWCSKHFWLERRNPRPRRRPSWTRRGVINMKARNLSQIWRKKSRREFLLRVALVRSKEAQARVLTFLSILQWLRAWVLRTWYKTSVPISTSVGIQVASSGTVGPLCFNESTAGDFENWQILCWRGVHVQGDPAGNRCKVSRKPSWRCVQ